MYIRFEDLSGGLVVSVVVRSDIKQNCNFFFLFPFPSLVVIRRFLHTLEENNGRNLTSTLNLGHTCDTVPEFIYSYERAVLEAYYQYGEESGR